MPKKRQAKSKARKKPEEEELPKLTGRGKKRILSKPEKTPKPKAVAKSTKPKRDKKKANEKAIKDSTSKGKKKTESAKPSSKAAKEAKASKGGSKGSGKTKYSEEVLKKAVDNEVGGRDLYKVYYSEEKIYSESLMWSDLRNNNNKYYIIQLLQASPTHFLVFNKWGRVGKKGGVATFKFNNIQNAIKQYQAKYNQKTRKGYTPIQIVFDDEEETKQTGFRH